MSFSYSASPARGPGPAGPGEVMSSVAPPAALAGAVPARAYRPVRSGTVPALVDGFSPRPETAPGVTAALPAGAAVALIPDRRLPGQTAPARRRLPKPRTG